MKDALSCVQSRLGRPEGFSQRLEGRFSGISVWIGGLVAVTLIVSSCAAIEIDMSTGSSDTEVGSASVVDRIIDGDTLVVDGQRVRIIGVSASEVDECYGTEATEALGAIVAPGDSVTVEYDLERSDTGATNISRKDAIGLVRGGKTRSAECLPAGCATAVTSTYAFHASRIA